MTISVDWENRIISSTASITDLPLFHAALRNLEDDAAGVIYPATHTWKALDQGGGAFLYQLDLINGYQLKFPNAGSYTITGNLNGEIIPVAGVYVERERASAYITTAIGASGVTPDQIWQRSIEDGMTAEQMMRIIFAALAGVTSGIGTSTENYMALDGTTPRISATFDSSNNRTALTLDGG